MSPLLALPPVDGVEITTVMDNSLDLPRNKQFAIDQKRGATLHQELYPLPLQVME